ncbi:unnamed protein product [Cyclocybe aegerita]|uniref:Putative lipoate-protein ligase A n=1 Tax=Cyclocybe aegerita TaxID=1973307 RepID=A0A8S0XKE8_CYCAE|nr:unnamed protein product [Cyclocybe aegerita]
MLPCWHLSRRASTHLVASINLIRSSLCRNTLFSPKRTARREISTAGVGALEDIALGPNCDIYISTSTDPYFNLTVEDWLFRHARESSPLLFIYRNSPCVVIGRHQNPWTEVNFGALRAAGIPFLRRRSGGGTVFHDLGNSNFSVHLPRASFDRHVTGQLVLRAVRALDIDARLNERNDICVGPDKISILHHFPPTWPYFAGSAYKIVNRRAYHHGTMLISTRLDQLGDVLRPVKKQIVTKGVESVRSPVCNLQQYKRITHEDFKAALITEFRKDYGIVTDACLVQDTAAVRSMGYICQGISELTTWDWLYGQTPEFTQTASRIFPWGEAAVRIRAKHGVILECSLQVENTLLSSAKVGVLQERVRAESENKRYGFEGEVLSKNSAMPKSCIPSTSEISQGEQAFRDVELWLGETMQG